MPWRGAAPFPRWRYGAADRRGIQHTARARSVRCARGVEKSLQPAMVGRGGCSVIGPTAMHRTYRCADAFRARQHTLDGLAAAAMTAREPTWSVGFRAPLRAAPTASGSRQPTTQRHVLLGDQRLHVGHRRSRQQFAATCSGGAVPPPLRRSPQWRCDEPQSESPDPNRATMMRPRGRLRRGRASAARVGRFVVASSMLILA